MYVTSRFCIDNIGYGGKNSINEKCNNEYMDCLQPCAHFIFRVNLGLTQRENSA